MPMLPPRPLITALVALAVFGIASLVAKTAVAAATGMTGDGSTYLALTASGSEVMRLTSTSVGIGTTYPEALLDVFKEDTSSNNGVWLYSLAGSSWLSGNETNSHAEGVRGNAQSYSGGGGNTLTSFDSNSLATGTGTVANLYGYYNVTGVYSSAVVTNNYGAYLGAPYGDHIAGIVNNYGLYVADQSPSGTTSSFNIFSAGANSKNYFAGKVGIGTTTPAEKLDLNGGNVKMGYEIVNGNFDSNYSTATCSAGKVVLGGGCNSQGYGVTNFYPPNTTSWYCAFTGQALGAAYAICANMK